jgi:hypothetical protein
VATMYKHVNEPPLLHGAAASLIPESLVPVLEVALAKDPKARFGDAGEMHDALVQARDEMRKRGTSPVVTDNGSSMPVRPGRAFSGPYPREALLLVPALVRALESADRGIRVGAAEALARTPDESARGALEVAVLDEDRELRERARDALRSLAGPVERVEGEPLAPTSDIDGDIVVPPLWSDADTRGLPDPQSGRETDPTPTPALTPIPMPTPVVDPRPRPIPRWVFWLVGLGVVVLLLLIASSKLLVRRSGPTDVTPPATLEVLATPGLVPKAPPTAIPETKATPLPPPASLPTRRPTAPRPVGATTLPPASTTVDRPHPSSSCPR